LHLSQSFHQLQAPSLALPQQQLVVFVLGQQQQQQQQHLHSRVVQLSSSRAAALQPSLLRVRVREEQRVPAVLPPCPLQAVQVAVQQYCSQVPLQYHQLLYQNLQQHLLLHRLLLMPPLGPRLQVACRPQQQAQGHKLGAQVLKLPLLSLPPTSRQRQAGCQLR
jgi:hypothetical protein